MAPRLSVLFSVVTAVAAATQNISAAEIVSQKSHIVPGPLRITEHLFKVPLDYDDPEGETITLFGRSATNYEVPIVATDGEDESAPLPYMVFLAGGPGFGNPEPQNHALTQTALERGYQLLLLDHRGTGHSTPVSTKMLEQLDGGEDAQVEYLRKMRQDNTVRDCEAVRKALTKGLSDEQAKWSVFGQSYGGFVALSYLSFHPEGVREVFLTGGLAPVGKSAEQVYESLYPRVIKRNEEYYKKLPEDIENVRQVANYIQKQGGSVDLPAGGSLTVPRLMTIGIAFGDANGFSTVHSTIMNLKLSLDQFGFLSRASLVPMETFTTFDTNIIYAILHEAIYCDGPNDVSNWASDRVARDMNLFSWLSSNGTFSSNSSQPLLFAGENIFPFFFDTYPELIPLKNVANKLAAIDDWTHIYDKEQLAKNDVPVYSATYINDMYVDYEYAKDTAKLVKGTKTWETNSLVHSALRTNTEVVLKELFNLRDNVMD